MTSAEDTPGTEIEDDREIRGSQGRGDQGRWPRRGGDMYLGEGDYSTELEKATRGLLELSVAVLERMDKTVGLTSLRALQALRRRGPSMVTELATDLDMLSSTVSRLSDRLADAELITRRVSPTNRRATQLELAPAGQAVLDELVAIRAAALDEITAHLTDHQRQALLEGTRAFTRARTQRSPEAR